MEPSLTETRHTSSSSLRLSKTLHFIDGEEVPSLAGRTFESRNPATDELLGQVAFAESVDVDRAVDAAWRAFEEGSWRWRTPAARAECLRRVAALIRERAEEIAHVDALDAGKPITDARRSVEGAARGVEYAATLPENVRGHVFAREAGFLSYSVRDPYGVVGVITPWNFPFQLAASKTAPALAVGNSVVLKMAEQTPLSTNIFANICLEAGIPAGVLNVVHGDGFTTGAALANHPRVPKLSFTGSTEVGRQILASGAHWIKSCDVELGGKSPNIVFADANLDQAVAGSLFTSFYNAGQVCSSGSRLLVHESIEDELISALVTRARGLSIGDPLSETTKLGPLISPEQLARVAGYVSAGMQAGASVLIGGSRPTLDAPFDRGAFFEPTVFADVAPTMAIAQEEIFGPVLSVMRFKDEDEALHLANNVAYGLTATLWTNSLDRALRFSERLQAGIIWTNTLSIGGPHTPLEGHKLSGTGETGGLESIHTFTRLKVHHIDSTGAPLSW